VIATGDYWKMQHELQLVRKQTHQYSYIHADK